MTTSFSFSRLLKLVRKQWFENSRLYLFGTLALLALQALTFTFWAQTHGPRYSEDIVYIIFLLGLFITGAIFGSMSFSMLGDKSKGAYWLAFPASELEKLVCVILYTTVFFVVVYYITFLPVKTIAVDYVKNLTLRFPDKYEWHPLRTGDEFWVVFRILLYAFFAAQALYIMGSVYFSRYSFVITTIIGTALIFLFMYMVFVYTRHSVLSELRWDGYGLEKQASVNGHSIVFRRYEFPHALGQALTFLSKYMWAPVFWLITWFRLKEKQL